MVGQNNIQVEIEWVDMKNLIGPILAQKILELASFSCCLDRLYSLLGYFICRRGAREFPLQRK